MAYPGTLFTLIAREPHAESYTNFLLDNRANDTTKKAETHLKSKITGAIVSTDRRHRTGKVRSTPALPRENYYRGEAHKCLQFRPWLSSFSSKPPAMKTTRDRAQGIFASDDGKMVDANGMQEHRSHRSPCMAARGYINYPVSAFSERRYTLPAVDGGTSVVSSFPSKKRHQILQGMVVATERCETTTTPDHIEAASRSAELSGRSGVQAREDEAAARSYRKAVCLRRRQLRQHACCLIDAALSGCDCSVFRDMNPALHWWHVKLCTRVRRQAAYAEQHAHHLRIPVLSRNYFREIMSESRAKRAEGTATSASGMMRRRTDIYENALSEHLVGARATAKKSCVLRYQLRWHEIAAFHCALKTGSSRRSIGEVLEKLGQAMSETACENSSPGYMSRTQFVAAASSVVDTCDLAALHRLYSSFDPDGTDWVRNVDILACLHVTHKPETQEFLEQIQQTFLRNLGAVDREVQAELTKGGRQVAWRFLRLIFALYEGAGGGHGLALHEVGRLFQLCAMSNNDSLQMSSAFDSWTKDNRRVSTQGGKGKDFTADRFEREFCLAWPLLDLFNMQMTLCQCARKNAPISRPSFEDTLRCQANGNAKALVRLNGDTRLP